MSATYSQIVQVKKTKEREGERRRENNKVSMVKCYRLGNLSEEVQEFFVLFMLLFCLKLLKNKKILKSTSDVEHFMIL